MHNLGNHATLFSVVTLQLMMLWLGKVSLREIETMDLVHESIMVYNHRLDSVTTSTYRSRNTEALNSEDAPSRYLFL